MEGGRLNLLTNDDEDRQMKATQSPSICLRDCVSIALPLSILNGCWPERIIEHLADGKSTIQHDVEIFWYHDRSHLQCSSKIENS